MLMHFEILVQAAKSARGQAYAPYSKFQVGGFEGQGWTDIYRLQRREHFLRAYRLRRANWFILGRFSRTNEFTEIVIVADTREPISPCGACRQVLAEFAPNLEIVTANLHGESFRANLDDLLPRPKAGILDH